MIPEGLCDQLQPLCPSSLPVPPGLEPGYSLAVHGDGHVLDDAGFQGFLVSRRLFVGLSGGTAGCVLLEKRVITGAAEKIDTLGER